MIGLAYLAVHSPLLDVDHIRVTGAQHVSRSPRSSAPRRPHRRSRCCSSTPARSPRAIERLPWVEHASVRRDFPGTVAITVTEYAPTTFVRVSRTQVALVAATGQVDRVRAVGTARRGRGASA